MKTYLADACILIGFLLILGTAGASDMDNITVSQALMQSIIGLAAAAVGIVINAGIRMEEENHE